MRSISVIDGGNRFKLWDYRASGVPVSVPSRIRLPWMEVKDGDPMVRAMFDRHYSRYVYADVRRPKLFMGPGEKIVLRTPGCDAIFGWRKFIDRSGQRGVNCAIFRNESKMLSSWLILEAETWKEERWPGERMYTYVDPERVRSRNPGYCFIMAGWRRCGVTASGKLILEKQI